MFQLQLILPFLKKFEKLQQRILLFWISNSIEAITSKNPAISRLKTTFYILRNVYMFPTDHAFQFYKLAMIFQLLDILDSTRPWSLFLGTSGSFKCERLSRSMCFYVIYVRVLRTPNIGLMDYCSRYMFPSNHGLLFQRISSLIYHHQILFTAFVW